MSLRDTIQPLRAFGPVKMGSIRRCVQWKGILHHSCHVEQLHWQDTFLLDLPDDLVDMAHPFIHAHRILIRHYVVGDRENREHY